jgi:hypothetical protein
VHGRRLNPYCQGLSRHYCQFGTEQESGRRTSSPEREFFDLLFVSGGINVKRLASLPFAPGLGGGRSAESPKMSSRTFSDASSALKKAEANKGQSIIKGMDVRKYYTFGKNQVDADEDE